MWNLRCWTSSVCDFWRTQNSTGFLWYTRVNNKYFTHYIYYSSTLFQSKIVNVHFFFIQYSYKYILVLYKICLCKVWLSLIYYVPIVPKYFFVKHLISQSLIVIKTKKNVFVWLNCIFLNYLVLNYSTK